MADWKLRGVAPDAVERVFIYTGQWDGAGGPPVTVQRIEIDCRRMTARIHRPVLLVWKRRPDSGEEDA